MKRRLPTGPRRFAETWQGWSVNAVTFVILALVLHQGRFANIISCGWTILAVAAIGIATYKFFHDPRE